MKAGLIVIFIVYGLFLQPIYALVSVKPKWEFRAEDNPQFARLPFHKLSSSLNAREKKGHSSL